MRRWVSLICLPTCRIISAAQSYQQSTTPTPLQHLSPAAARSAAAASSRLGSAASRRSASASSQPADLSPAAAEHAVSPAQPSDEAQGESAGSAPGAADHSAARHSSTTEDALQATRAMANDWAAGRLSLSYPPDKDDKDSVGNEPNPRQSSMQGASSAAVLLSVMSSLQQVPSWFLSHVVVQQTRSRCM